MKKAGPALSIFLLLSVILLLSVTHINTRNDELLPLTPELLPLNSGLLALPDFPVKIVSTLGEGYLDYHAPHSIWEDYLLLFYSENPGSASAEPLYCFRGIDIEPDREFQKIAYLYAQDITEDGTGDLFIIGQYEKENTAYFESRFYIGKDNGYDLDYVISKQMTEWLHEADDISGETVSDELERLYKEQSSRWEYGYKRILYNYTDYIPFDEWNAFYGRILLGLHDFDGDDIPELILGNYPYMLRIYGYENNELKQIINLGKETGCLSTHMIDNMLILVCTNVDNNVYECFTYKDGEYITGRLIDYLPDQSLLNGRQVTFDEFQSVFHTDIDQWRGDHWADYVELQESTRKNFIDIRENDINFMTIDLQEIYW